MPNNLKKTHHQAREAILKHLEEVAFIPSYERKFTGSETSFDISDYYSTEGRAKREIFFDALNSLYEDGLVTADSSIENLPIHGLKLTAKGINRAKNPIDTWKNDGIRAAISVTLSTLGRYLQTKFGG
ncbi:hypothetical protein [Vibrio sp. WXL210]|uniref:hypothetical protein n=1 Tax=Vibrio sp. WXL210 TaxID=3450709 RepID=UPI003EC4D6C9